MRSHVEEEAANAAAFRKMRHPKQRHGKYALMHDGKIMGWYGDRHAAWCKGLHLPGQLFSIHLHVAGKAIEQEARHVG